MIEEKMSRLLDVLASKTEEGKILWKATANQNMYLADFKEFGVTVESIGPTSQTPTYSLSLRNQDGDEIESKREYSDSEPDYRKLKNLFNFARRSVHNVEESLDSILRKLEA